MENSIPSGHNSGAIKEFVFYAIIAGLGVLAAQALFKFITPPRPDQVINTVVAPAVIPPAITKIPETAPLPATETKTEVKTEATAEVKIENNVAPKAETAPETITQSPPAVDTAKLKEIEKSLTLSGIFSSGSEAYAIINNEIVKVGSVIGQVKVTRIDTDEVELEYAGSKIFLNTRK